MVITLLKDKRVPGKLKLLPVLPLLYFLIPVDFVPDLLPFPGFLDDLFFSFFVLERFIGLLPPSLREEYLTRFHFKEPGTKEIIKAMQKLNKEAEKQLDKTAQQIAEKHRALAKSHPKQREKL